MMNDARTMFGIDAQALERAGAGHTAAEISQQAVVWNEVVAQWEHERPALEHFLAPLLARTNLRVILSGAGSSAFIGECLAASIAQALGRRVESIATTDLVCGPTLHLNRETPTLLVSFARSGNSPESMAAAALADGLVDDCWHLAITCNKEGELHHRLSGRADAYVLALPDKTHDQAFAMTSSFSSMLLAAALIFGALSRETAKGLLDEQKVAAHITRIAYWAPQLVALNAQRVVYLGSNALKGIARESALKLLELTDGATVATSDSSLGFRHGPKTIVNGQALLVLLLSNDPYTRQYDIDLLNELRADNKALRVIAVTAQNDAVCAHPDHILIEHMADAPDLALCLSMLVIGQVFALLQSLSLGVRSDTPNPTGTVNRVVRGVTIHALE